jgi:hypothetical protein
MEQKDSKIFNKSIMQAVSAFCDANNIEDKDDFIYLCFKQGFDIKKFGLLGKTGIVGEKQVEIEVIREKRVEVPVEVIKEVEKIVEVIKEVTVEVPVEKVITKIEYISDKTSENELLLKIQQLEEEMSKKDNELDELRRNLDIILDKPPIEIEKIVEVDKSTDKLKMMSTTLQNLRNDLSLKNDKITELEKINQELQKTANLQNAVYMKGSNLNSRI